MSRALTGDCSRVLINNSAVAMFDVVGSPVAGGGAAPVSVSGKNLANN